MEPAGLVVRIIQLCPAVTEERGSLLANSLVMDPVDILLLAVAVEDVF